MLTTLQPTIATPPLSNKRLINMDLFNDDDIYVYHASTRELVKQYDCYLHEVRDSRNGFKVAAGHTWAKGLRAKYLGLWSAA